MLSDEELKSLIESTLLNDRRLSSHPILITVNEGRVSLEGTVQSYRRKLLVQQICASFDGARDVTNKLRVAPHESVSDDEIANDVRNALNASADVTKETVQVSVTGGKVTLQGAVGSVWEQAVAEDVVRGVRGVREVVNLLMVNIEAKIGDEELANSIKAALSRARGLKEADLGVAVAGNLVTLSGRLPQLWQKEIAESVVRQFGLMHIQNEIEVTG